MKFIPLTMLQQDTIIDSIIGNKEKSHPKGYAQFLTPDDKLIFRRLYGNQLGNFVMLSVIYNGSRYSVGSGDEYLRGANEPFLIEESRKWK